MDDVGAGAREEIADEVPAGVLELSGLPGLGNLRGRVRPYGRSWQVIGFALAVALDVGAVLVVGALDQAALAELRPLLYVALALGAWLGVEGLVRGRRRVPVELYEFDHGLVRRAGDDLLVLPWEEAEFVVRLRATSGQGGLIERSHQVRRRGSAQPVIRLERDEDVDRIRARIGEDAVRRARPRIDAGETVRFGRVSLSREGVVVDGAALPWWELDRVVRARTALRFYRHGRKAPWASPPLSGVPDADAVVTLAHDLAGRAGSRPR